MRRKRLYSPFVVVPLTAALHLFVTISLLATYILNSESDSPVAAAPGTAASVLKAFLLIWCLPMSTLATRIHVSSSALVQILGVVANSFFWGLAASWLIALFVKKPSLA